MRRLFFLPCVFAVALIGVSVFQYVPVKAFASGGQQQKIKIESADDLPRHSYKISGTVSDLVTSAKAFKPFALQVCADIEADLAAYEIGDKTTLRRWYGTLVTFDMIDGRYDSALEGIKRMRELQDKPAQKLTSGLIGEPTIIALQAADGNTDSPIYKEVFLREFSAKVEKLPWDIVQDEIEQLKGIVEMFGENMIIGLIQSQIEPVVERSGEISMDIALQVVNIRNLLAFTIPIREEIISVLQQWVDQNKVAKKDIWKERAVTLTKEDNGTPVLVAIWDTGVDISLFQDHLFINENEKIDGKDTDGNGFVDDVHGIAYNMWWKKSPVLLYPLGDATSRANELLEEIKGFFDIQSAVDSPEASAVKQRSSTMEPGEVKEFLEDLMRCALYVHGTHVAGIAAEGNPYIKILTARMAEDYRVIPRPPTVKLAKDMALGLQETVDYFKAHGVRAVNMSWGIGLKEVEGELEVNGIGENTEERAKLAREIFDIMRKGMRSAIESAPDILFVVAAGNADADVAFDDDCPASFGLPNVLAVGAVDQEGQETNFTSFGDRVNVYSNGFEVESLVPGGRRIPFSGTSMSSPNVINLAAKLLAIDPSLTPVEVIALIEKGATKSEGSKELLLIHPKQTVELLKKR